MQVCKVFEVSLGHGVRSVEDTMVALHPDFLQLLVKEPRVPARVSVVGMREKGYRSCCRPHL